MYLKITATVYFSILLCLTGVLVPRTKYLFAEPVKNTLRWSIELLPPSFTHFILLLPPSPLYVCVREAEGDSRGGGEVCGHSCVHLESKTQVRDVSRLQSSYKMSRITASASKWAILSSKITASWTHPQITRRIHVCFATVILAHINFIQFYLFISIHPSTQSNYL